MKLVDMGHGATAIEPDEKTDRITPPDLSQLVGVELTAENIKAIYRQYIHGLLTDIAVSKEPNIG